MGIWLHSPRAYFALFILVLLFRVATALPLTYAGYMDASYAMHVAGNLAGGQGFVEDVLWNYLDNPAGLPHPSNLYWMPLPSILIAPFFAWFGASYRVAQIPFIVLSSLLPLFTFYLTRKIFDRDDYAWTAALFVTFSGFYTIYWVSPDNFTPFALTASLCLFFIGRGLESAGESGRRGAWNFFIAGILVALSHLSRADGVLLLAVVPIALFANKPTRNLRHYSLSIVYCLLGYMLVMSPWFVRDYLALGTPYPSAGTKTLWLTGYDEVFRFTDDLTPARYLAWGVGNIAASKLHAGGINLLVITFGALQIFLAPFALIGLWQQRHRVELLPFFIYTPLLYLALTLAFTFPSVRGSTLHSAAALLLFLVAAAPRGIDMCVEWVARHRRSWNAAQAVRVFRVGFVALAIFLAIYLYALGVFPIGGGASDIPLWNLRDIEYVPIAHWLDQNARADDVVMTVDPPAFYNASHRRTIVIPTDSVAAVFLAAQKYDARYLVLQFDHPQPLDDLYLERVTIPGLTRVADFRDGNDRPVTVFEVAQ